MPKSSSRTRKVCNTLCKCIKKYLAANNDRTNVNVAGATTEVATLKEALSKAEDNAAMERSEQEKQEAQVAEVRQELNALVKKHERLELDSKTRESELASALESARSAKAEAQKALQEIEAMKRIAAGKAFFMQSKHVKVNYLLLTQIRSSPGAFADLPRSVSDVAAFYGLRRGARQRKCSGLSTLRPDSRCP